VRHPLPQGERETKIKPLLKEEAGKKKKPLLKEEAGKKKQLQNENFLTTLNIGKFGAE